jgi:hypothetical protein
MSKKGMDDRCRDLAASIVSSRQTMRRLDAAKLNIDAVDRQLEQLRCKKLVNDDVSKVAVKTFGDGVISSC